MGNLQNSLKRFLTNKNTVTFLGVLVGIVVLFFGYQYRVNVAISLISVPVAKEEIPANTKITNDMLTIIKLSKAEVDKIDNLYLNKNQIINKVVKYNTTVPKNGLFYHSTVVNESELPDSIVANIPDNYRLFSIDISKIPEFKYGNVIIPGSYIDIDLKAVLTTGANAGKIYNGRIIKSIEVLGVIDNDGNNVFEGKDLKRPSAYLFAVDEEMYKILSNVVFANADAGANMDLIPVPRNAKYTQNAAETEITSSILVDYIKQFVVPLPDEE